MPATDLHANTSEGLYGPANNAAAVVIDTEFTYVSRALYVGGAGSVVAVMADDSEVTFSGVVAGSILPIRCKKVKTGSTATLMVALW